jgi:thymidylate kinase
VRDRLLGRAGAPEEPPRLDPRPSRLGRARDALVWNATLRRLLYPVDLLMFLVVRLWVELLRGRVLIMDRYFYDTLVDFAAREGRVRRDLLLRLTPRPDLAVYLDVDPREAFARKREYSVEYLARRADAYRALFPHLPSALRLAATDPVSVQRAIAAAMRERSVA